MTELRGHAGACTYYVCIGRGIGEGVTPNADVKRKLSKGGCVKIQTRREWEGSQKNLKILQISYIHGPLWNDPCR